MYDEIKKQWLERISQQKASGKSAAIWCSENNIPYKNYIKWRKRLSAAENWDRSSFIEPIEDQEIFHGWKLKCTVLSLS